MFHGCGRLVHSILTAPGPPGSCVSTALRGFAATLSTEETVFRTTNRKAVRDQGALALTDRAGSTTAKCRDGGIGFGAGGAHGNRSVPVVKVERPSDFFKFLRILTTIRR